MAVLRAMIVGLAGQNSQQPSTLVPMATCNRLPMLGGYVGRCNYYVLSCSRMQTMCLTMLHDCRPGTGEIEATERLALLSVQHINGRPDWWGEYSSRPQVFLPFPFTQCKSQLEQTNKYLRATCSGDGLQGTIKLNTKLPPREVRYTIPHVGINGCIMTK
jgi:hypothetical protein